MDEQRAGGPADGGSGTDESPAPATDGTERGRRPAGRTSMRYTRRRLLILGGALAAGAAAVIAGLRAFGGSTASKVGGALSDQFGPFPVRSVEDVPEVPADRWRVTVDGLVERPLSVDRATWTSLPRKDQTVDFHCVEGWTVDDVHWGGVAPSELLERAGVKPEGTWVVVHAESGEYFSSVPLELMTHPQTMLADMLAGQPLPPKHGGPLRLVVPVQLGYKSVKWVNRLEVTDAARAGYWESRGYPEDAPVREG